MSGSGSARKKRPLRESPPTASNTTTEDKGKCTTMSRIIKDFGDLRDYLDNEYLANVTETIRAEVSPLQALVSNVQLSLTEVERKIDSLERELN
jgi:hypothetical protein